MAEPVDRLSGAEERGEHLFCPYCGTEDETDYGYCDHCGERVAAPDAVRYNPQELGRCQVCSAENLLHARHCVGCGVELEEKPLRQIGARSADSAVKDAAYPDPAVHDDDVPTSGTDEITRVRPDRPPLRPRERNVRERIDRWGRAEMDDVRRQIEREEREGDEAVETFAAEEENDSGTPNAELPPELKGFNWGACLLGPVWGIGNGVWPAAVLFLAIFIPSYFGILIYLGGAAYLGTRANEFAWRSKKWSSVRQFKRTQQNWAFWGFIISPVIFFVLLSVPTVASG